jgi:hypothetical protein
MKPANERLDGWKEIACHLKRSVRCVQRWERNEKLPVRRHEHEHGVSVYALPDELEVWWQKKGSDSKDLFVEERCATAEETEERNRERAGLDPSVPDHNVGKRALRELGVTTLEVAVAISLLKLLKTQHIAVIPEREVEKIRTRYALISLESER